MSKKLKAPKGTDEANADGKSFRVDNDGTVTVPDEAAAPLIERAGFVEVLPDIEVPHGHAMVKHTDPDASCGFEKRGDVFIVPVSAVAELVASHGFLAIEGEIEEKKPEDPGEPAAQ